MPIRLKILLYFSITVISLTVISSGIIYYLFAQYREEEFQQRLKEKIRFTVALLREYKEMSESLSNLLDKHTIHALYDEKILIFDKDKSLVYKSPDDLRILNYEQLLNSLSPAQQWIEAREGKYDLVAVYVESDNNHFYAISKAYDVFGHSKLAYLRTILVSFTIIISCAVLLLTYYLSRRISAPLVKLAGEVNALNVGSGRLSEIHLHSDTREIQNLIENFNRLIRRTNEAFSFQKHLAQHISHQLKTPLAVVLSELEKALNTADAEEKRKLIEAQIGRVKTLGEMVNTLLEISGLESGNIPHFEPLRLDELLFDVLTELKDRKEAFTVQVEFRPPEPSEESLTIQGHPALLRHALVNLAVNAIQYSPQKHFTVILDTLEKGYVNLCFQNEGAVLHEQEMAHLFKHFFRGHNSAQHPGFGLGLALVKKIAELHNARIVYEPRAGLNVFKMTFALSPL